MRLKKIKLSMPLFFFVSFFFLVGVRPVLAQQEGTVVSDAENRDQAPVAEEEKLNVIINIDVEGNKIISTGTILSKVQSKRYTKLSRETVNSDIKRLYETGFFEDVKIDVREKRAGVKLTIIVEEKPIVRQIIIEGNKVFSESKIRKEINIIEGQIIDYRILKESVSNIKEKYYKKGYRFIDIKMDVDINEDTKEAVVYLKIDEGGKFKIKEISFEGVKSFKEKEVKKLLKTKADGLFTSGVFKEDVFENDLEKVKLFYNKHGYMDVKVTSDMRVDRVEQKLYITIIIDEGKKYVTGDIKIQGNLLFPDSDIWQSLDMLPGLVYSQIALMNDVDSIRKYYFERGYIMARVMPDVRMNRETGKVDVVYRITEGDLYFVDKVKIRGNTKTKDIVIRRELRVRPGERFDGAKLERSKQRLENLGYFSEVTYETEEGSEPNRRNVIFNVKEKQTGELSFGAGVSSLDQFVGFAEISQRNFDITNFPRFTGGGQSISLRGRIGTVTRDIDFSFVEPYIFNKPISFATNIYNVTREKNNVHYDEERRGGSISFSKAFTEFIRAGIGYTYEQVKLDEISLDAPSVVTASGTKNNLSRIKFTMSRDTRNSVFDPTKGTLLKGSLELIGSVLGGDQDLYNWDISFTKWWSPKKDHVFRFKNMLSVVSDFGSSDQVPVFERYYAGGLGTVRGFEYRRVGPKENGEAIGGNTLFVSSVEYTFPIFKHFRGAFFIDIGQVAAESYDLKGGDFAVSVGPGLKVSTPIGPMAFYYGFPISNRDTESENGRFEFSLSRGI